MEKIFGSKVIIKQLCFMNGLELKQLRLKHNLTQSDLGDKIGVTKSKISEWENGKHTISNAYQLLLSKLFNELAKS